MDLCGSLNWGDSVFVSIEPTAPKFIVSVRLPFDNIDECRFGKWTAMVYFLSGTARRLSHGEKNIPIFLEFLVEEARILAKDVGAGTILEIFRGIEKIGEVTVLDYDHAA
jgi:hypothetical protein